MLLRHLSLTLQCNIYTLLLVFITTTHANISRMSGEKQQKWNDYDNTEWFVGSISPTRPSQAEPTNDDGPTGYSILLTLFTWATWIDTANVHTYATSRSRSRSSSSPLLGLMKNANMLLVVLRAARSCHPTLVHTEHVNNCTTAMDSRRINSHRWRRGVAGGGDGTGESTEFEEQKIDSDRHTVSSI